jgi:ubiquinone/menaquinone biosynthesis C-methylase UbiE
MVLWPKYTREVPDGARVLDIGGGSGRSRSLWPDVCTYTVLDLDLRMLRAMSRRGRSGFAVKADATQLPIRDASTDWVLCKQISHHVDDERLTLLFSEIRRVLRPYGRLLFFDCIWNPESRIGRLLWKYDQGSHPRTEDQLRAVAETEFDILELRRMVNNHHFLLLELMPRRSDACDLTNMSTTVRWSREADTGSGDEPPNS